jgi:YegS/Rv2252/BmrU family lipid kinase
MQRPGQASAERAAEKAALEDFVQTRREAVFIVNTRSRRGQRAYAHVKQLLQARGVTLAAAYPVRDPSRLPEVTRQAIAQGHRFIILGGGDGTISSVAGAFAYQDVVFGLIPLGTANSFARSLGVPLDPEGAVDLLLTGKVVDVDLGRIDGDYFANAAAIGLAASIARSIPHGVKKWLGRVGYLLAAGVLLTRLKPFRCVITTEDGKRLEFDEALEVRIANGPYKGGLLIAQEASLESRDLTVHVVKGRSPTLLARVWGTLAMGRRPSTEELASFQRRTFTIETDPPQYVSIDGEAVTRTPVRVSVAGNALRIIAPRARDDLN